MELWLLLLLWELLLRLRLHGNIGLNLRRGGGSARDGRPATLFGVVDEVASGAIRAETGSVKCAAKFGLVFRVTAEVAQFVGAMGKLTLVAVLTGASLLKWPTEFRLVMRGHGVGG